MTGLGANLPVEMARLERGPATQGGANGVKSVAGFRSFWVADSGSSWEAGLEHFDRLVCAAYAIFGSDTLMRTAPPKMRETESAKSIG
jgi:hypothetical protein